MRLLHGWFRFWERVIPGLYRVVAVAVAATATTFAVAFTTRTTWWAQLPLALACWVLLAKIEGDAASSELANGPDPEFARLVSRHIGPVAAGGGFVWNGATRGRSHDGSLEDAVLYEAPPREFATRFPDLINDEPRPCVDLWIKFDPARRLLSAVTIEGHALVERLRAAGHLDVADRLAAPSGNLDSDVPAVAHGLALLLTSSD
jgi:hypothetical protein